jgi:Flp pilus assembly pilin Flp
VSSDGTEGAVMNDDLKRLWRDTEGQDVAEYAIMLAIVLVFVTGMVRMIGTNASTVFSQVGSAIQ